MGARKLASAVIAPSNSSASMAEAARGSAVLRAVSKSLSASLKSSPSLLGEVASAGALAEVDDGGAALEERQLRWRPLHALLGISPPSRASSGRISIYSPPVYTQPANPPPLGSRQKPAKPSPARASGQDHPRRPSANTASIRSWRTPASRCWTLRRSAKKSNSRIDSSSVERKPFGVRRAEVVLRVANWTSVVPLRSLTVFQTATESEVFSCW